MAGTVHLSGGWGQTATRMSPSLAARVAAADRDYDAQTRQQERQRAIQAASDHERRIRASVEMALARGELVDMRQALREGHGRTPSEALSYYSALGDLEDAKEAARQRASGLNDQTWSAFCSADTSAPHPAEITADRELLERGRARRNRRREITAISRAVVRSTQWRSRRSS